MPCENVLVLKTSKYKDADLIVQALSNKGLRYHFLARQALKSRKRFGGGVLEPMNYIEVQYDNRKSKTQFVPLTEAKILRGFPGIRTDYDKITLGLKFLNDTLLTTREGDIENPQIFNLLGQALKILEDDVERAHLLFVFRIKLLFYSGVLDNDEGLFDDFIKTKLKDYLFLIHKVKVPHRVSVRKSFHDLTGHIQGEG